MGFLSPLEGRSLSSRACLPDCAQQRRPQSWLPPPAPLCCPQPPISCHTCLLSDRAHQAPGAHGGGTNAAACLLATAGGSARGSWRGAEGHSRQQRRPRSYTSRAGGAGTGRWGENTHLCLELASPCLLYTFFQPNFVSYYKNPEYAKSKTAATQTRDRQTLAATDTPRWDTLIQYARCRGLGRLTL